MAEQLANLEKSNGGMWKLLGTYTGAQTITLPSEYSEIMIVFWNGRGANHAYDNYVQIIPREALLSTTKQMMFTDAITAQNYNAYIAYTISLTALTTTSSTYGGQAHIADLETQVFYR